jgi:hypothetical protein
MEDYSSYYYTIKKMDNSIIESLISHEKGVNFVTTLAIQALHKYKTKKNKKLTYQDLVIRMNYWRKKNGWLKVLHRNPLNCALHYSMNIYNRNPKLIEPGQFRKNRLPVEFYEHINIVNNKVDIPITEMFFDVLPVETDTPKKYQDIRRITIALDNRIENSVLKVYGVGK